jgi:hypothetical protein
MKFRAKLIGVVQRPGGVIVASILWQSTEAVRYFGWWHQEAVIGRQREDDFTEEERERILPSCY